MSSFSSSPMTMRRSPYAQCLIVPVVTVELPQPADQSGYAAPLRAVSGGSIAIAMISFAMAMISFPMAMTSATMAMAISLQESGEQKSGNDHGQGSNGQTGRPSCGHG